MSTLTIVGGILCFIVIVAFMLFGKESGVGGSWSFSFPKWKMPKWISWGGFTKIFIALFVLYLIAQLGYEGRYFWQPPEHTSRWEIVEGTRIIVWTIPEIPAGFENEVTLTRPTGFIFRINKGDVAEVFFPGAKLFQSSEGKGEGFGRRLCNFLFGQDIKEPVKVFPGALTAEDCGVAKDAVVFRRGDRLLFSERGEQKIYITGGSIGDVPHLYYTLRKRTL